jgi:hypothetical protein
MVKTFTLTNVEEEDLPVHIIENWEARVCYTSLDNPVMVSFRGTLISNNTTKAFHTSWVDRITKSGKLISRESYIIQLGEPSSDMDRFLKERRIPFTSPGDQSTWDSLILSSWAHQLSVHPHMLLNYNIVSDVFTDAKIVDAAVKIIHMDSRNGPLTCEEANFLSTLRCIPEANMWEYTDDGIISYKGGFVMCDRVGIQKRDLRQRFASYVPRFDSQLTANSIMQQE